MTIRISTALAAGALATLALAPAANAYPAGPWGVEGPCTGNSPAECKYVPDPDGLTWKFYLNGEVYSTQYFDKTGQLVCSESKGAPPTGLFCAPIMGIIRALPPFRFPF
ncbi:hypothetical protein [Nocardia sp. NPDC024068]|uniref:hypothetical protein n=1 Tax=Nocardia sp. NPDC024068 TaxID=3157197 RepID=UPI0033F68D61